MYCGVAVWHLVAIIWTTCHLEQPNTFQTENFFSPLILHNNSSNLDLSMRRLGLGKDIPSQTRHSATCDVAELSLNVDSLYIFIMGGGGEDFA